MYSYRKIHPMMDSSAKSMDPKFRFWARLAAIVFSIQTFIFLIMAMAFLIFFYPKEERRMDFSLVLLRMGLPNANPSRKDTLSSRQSVNWHWKKGRPVDEDRLSSSNQFRFANYFQDSMVLQRDEPGAAIWGFGEANQSVLVTFNKQQFNTTVKEIGQWQVRLPVTPAGGPYLIQASSRLGGVPVAVKIRSVLFGDVWLCSGQSNMEFHVEWIFNSSEELKASSSYKNIRFMEVQASESPTPVLEPLLHQVWTSPDPVTLKEFSGLCWTYGRRLQEKLKIPIGLIGSYYGGTPIKAWSDPTVNNNCHESRSDRYVEYRGPGDDSVLWNAMIAPLVPLEIKGAIWYQGEADADGNAAGYLCMFPAMIRSWRSYFRRPALPFGFVQLGDRDEETDSWPAVRWHQTADTGIVPNKDLENVFMAVAMDLPDSKSPMGSIHPRYKEEIAERLAAGAFSLVYSSPTPFQGPRPISVSRDKNAVQVSFVNGPITVRDKASSLFEVCCGGKVHFPAAAASSWASCPKWTVSAISGSSGDSVSLDVSTCQGTDVLYVRYAWKTTPCPYLQCAVYGTDTKLPAGPFVVPLEGATAQRTAALFQ